ncbi:MAG TPA: ABC transporter permease [Thermotogota bacterium]|nr:ABC transporter permease [Thermotogota bacterium]HPJ89012.1 ABC transporter permease [Thermotogota bacterium]HPR95523.1 ABC transporter permease [Thermotogota bacterium]
MTLSYILGRIISAIPTILLLTFMVFISIHLVPGNVIDIMMGTQNYLSEEQVQELTAELGLDQPIIVQYFKWLKGLFTFDLGTSLRTGEPVSQMIADKFPITFELALMSIIFSLLIGIPFGLISSVKQNTPWDYSFRVLGLVGLSAPVFWIGAIFIVLISGTFTNYTLFGFVPFLKEPLKNLQIMLIPAITLGIMIAAQIMRMTRNSMLDVLSQDYVKVAKAKGLKGSKVIFKHALRNGMIPVVTTAGIQLGYLIGGTIVVESMFAIPGMGRMLLDAVNQRNYPVVQGVVAFIGIMIVLLNILIDILYSIIDPRIKLTD